jgi:hypothetical protein
MGTLELIIAIVVALAVVAILGQQLGLSPAGNALNACTAGSALNMSML